MIATGLMLLTALSAMQQGNDFRWTGTLAAGKTIEVRGISGSLSASPASGNQIEVTAVKKTRRGDPASVQIRIQETADGVTICEVYTASAGTGCNGNKSSRNNSERNDVVVDFTVRVPSNLRFEGSTVNGNVTASNLEGPADVGTVNGNVTVSTRSTASASTVNGTVNATLGKADWSGALKFSSVNGEVAVTLPRGASADVEASTVNGDIESEFPLTVQGKWGPRHMRGTLGSGGRTLSMTTVNGGITLKRGS